MKPDHIQSDFTETCNFEFNINLGLLSPNNEFGWKGICLYGSCIGCFIDNLKVGGWVGGVGSLIIG